MGVKRRVERLAVVATLGGEEATSEDLAEATVPSRARSRVRGGDPRRGSLLVVEDEAMLRAAIGRYLRKQGYEVETVERGDEALARLAQRPFDLVLLDLRLQDMAGDEVYQTLRSRAPEPAGGRRPTPSSSIARSA